MKLLSEQKLRSLGDLGRVVTGTTPSSNFPEDFGNEIPFVTPSDFGEYNKWATGSARGLSASGMEKLGNRILPKNSVLVTCIGSDMGKVVMNPVQAITNQQINAIIPDAKEIDSDYLYYRLVSIYELLRSYGESGTAVPILNKGDFERIEVEIPSSREEQHSIASILSSLDDKIDLLHRQNRTLEQLAQTLFRQWFVEEAEAGWEEKGLDEIAQFLNGLPCQKYPPEIGNLSLPVVKIKELRQGFTEESDIASAGVPAPYIVNNGDILFSWSGSLEIVLWSFGKGVLNQHLFKVTSEQYPPWFYYYWIKYHLPEFRGIAEDKATTMGHIQRGHLSSARVVVPPAPVLKKFDATIGPLFEKIKHNLMQIQTLTKLRDTLLPKLMSGEVRVK